MAIYHLTAKTGSRSKGQSAKAKNDYITRQGKYSRDSGEVIFSASGNMPDWASDPVEYWSAADVHERANGRLYKEVEFALPLELDLGQQIELAESFAQHLTGKESLPFTLAIHSGGGENPHCHLMINERINDGISRSPSAWFRRHDRKKPDQSGAKKTDKLKPKKWLQQTREDWASMANFALEKYGHDARIDHRTLIDQGIDRVPQIHIGQGAMALERKEVITDRGREALEIQEVNEEYERLKRAEEQQNEREKDPRPDPQGERPSNVEQRVGRSQKKTRTTTDDMEEHRPTIWRRVRSWLADRFKSRNHRSDDLDDKKPVMSDEAKALMARLKMTPEQRVLADRDRLNERMSEMRDQDKSQADEYTRSLEHRPRSLAPEGRSREM